MPAAQFVMGDLRRYGIGVDQNPALALDWYKRAAAGGYAPARREAERLEAGGVPAEARGACRDCGGPDAGCQGAGRQGARGQGPGRQDTVGRGAVGRGEGTASCAAGPRARRCRDRHGGDGRGNRQPAAAPPAPPPPAGKPGAARQHGSEPPPSPSPPSPQLPALAENSGPLTSEELFFQRTDGTGPAVATASDEAPAAGGQAEAAPFPAAPESGKAGPLPSPPKPAGLQVAASEPAAAAPLSGRFALWLGTAGNEKAADRLGRAVAERHRDSLGTLAVTVRRVEVAGLGAVYRVFAGDWAGRAEAERACDRLRAAEPATFCAAVAY